MAGRTTCCSQSFSTCWLRTSQVILPRAGPVLGLPAAGAPEPDGVARAHDATSSGVPASTARRAGAASTNRLVTPAEERRLPAPNQPARRSALCASTLVILHEPVR